MLIINIAYLHNLRNHSGRNISNIYNKLIFGKENGAPCGAPFVLGVYLVVSTTISPETIFLASSSTSALISLEICCSAPSSP